MDHALVAASPSQLSLDPAVSRIVIGTVRDIRPNQQSGGSIFTDAVVDVQEHLLKGPTESQVVVRSPGGSVNGLTTIVEDSPELKRGEQVLLFLSQQGNLVPVAGNVFTVRGLEQGIYHLNAGQAISPLPDRNQTLTNLRSVIQGSVSRR